MSTLIHDAFIGLVAIIQIGCVGLSIEGIHNELTRPSPRSTDSKE